MQPIPTEHQSPLRDAEVWWRDHYLWFEDQGYTLRARYKPGWVPSWEGKKGPIFKQDYEDGQVNNNLQLLDAVGPNEERVCLKRVSLLQNRQEPEITELFSTAPFENPKNHCTPLKKILVDPDDSNTVIMVLPLLRPWVSPPILTIGEAVEFIRQLFEGVHFMHEHNVAHRDIKDNNVMMDASELFPNGFHFVAQDRTPDFNDRAKYLTRTEKPPKYYLIDFGHAKQYASNDGSITDMPFPGGDFTVPEHQPDRINTPCDPFKVDVYCTGNILRWYFTEGLRDERGVLYYPKSGFEFLQPLIAKMVQDNPSERPTMKQVVDEFETIRTSLGTLTLRSRVAEKREWSIASMFRAIPHWMRAAEFVARGLPAMPSV